MTGRSSWMTRIRNSRAKHGRLAGATREAARKVLTDLYQIVMDAAPLRKKYRDLPESALEQAMQPRLDAIDSGGLGWECDEGADDAGLALQLGAQIRAVDRYLDVLAINSFV